MAPSAATVAEKVGDFELICSLKSNDLFLVHKYRSSVTGLTVVIAEVEGPVVNGYFCLATEAHDDDGLPHTLEHLIFLGSEKYPYKGVLDLLANRCLASGTNAWTDVDHTCYTMTTAGIEGFLSLLPIYLDHILYPTLTDSGFATEVHHVTGSGEDGGVVYCEMQGRETTAESLAQRALAQALYPGDCGYSSETGGILSNLRESTTNVKVRAYHRDFYRPENLTLVVAGAASPDAILSALAGRLDNRVERPAFQRPWQDPVPPLTESVDLEVAFPCDDEDSGLVRLGWRGPSAVTEMLELAACAVLLKYLTDTSVSPLAAAFVETEDPLASSVSFSLVENRESALVIALDGVPSGKLASAPAAVLACLGALDTLDMTRLRSVLRRHALETLSFLESQPHSALAFALIGDMLHGESEIDLSRRMNAVSELQALTAHPESFWLALLQRYFCDAPAVKVLARPSRAEQRRLEAAESARVAQRVAELGATGLALRQEELEQAMKNNEVPPPNSMLTSVPVPSVDGIRFIPVSGFESGSANQHPALDLNSAPVHASLDHLAANFIYVTALLDTSVLSERQRELLPLLLELLTESPVRRNGVLVPHATVVAELENDTVSTTAGLGLGGAARFSCGSFSSTATLTLQLEPGKLSTGLRWVRELLFETELTADRVRVVAAKMVNDVARAKRKGNKVALDLLRSLCFAPESNHVHGGALRQHRTLTALLSRLEGDSAVTALAELEATRQALVAPQRMSVHIAADATRLHGAADHADPWVELLPKSVQPHQGKLHVVPDWSQLSPSLKTGGGSDGCIVGLGCVESCFISHAVPGISDPEDPDLAPLLVFLQYLTQLEGPMWRRVRGAGLAYGYSVVPRPHEGLLHLSLYRATNGAAAFREMREICTAQLGSDATWDPALLAAARSSLVFEVVDRERSVGDVVSQALLARFRGVDQKYNRELVCKVAAVTEADLARVGPLHVAPLFSGGRSRTAIVCPPARVSELTAAFQEMGCNLNVSTLEDSFLSCSQ